MPIDGSQHAIDPSTEREANLERRMLRLKTWQCAAVLLIVIVFFGLIRFRLRDMPLERDEGEYAYSGQLLLQGVPPYSLAYNMKLPGIYAAYAVILAIFGQTPAGIHIGLLLVNAASTLLLCFLTARLFGRLAGIVTGCSFALLSTSSSVMGFEAHATNFVVFPAILGILLLLFALDTGSRWLFLGSGLLSGIAFMMKQHGAFFALFCFFYLASHELKQRREPRRIAARILLFGAGVVLPYASACWLLYRAGVFPEFWFWTVSYAAEYSKMGLHRAVHELLANFAAVTKPAIPVWILAAVGITAPLWNFTARKHSRFLAGLLICSFIALCPGAYFRPHYFILLLPAAAILAGVAIAAATEKLETLSTSLYRALPALVFFASLAYATIQQRQEYFWMKPVEVFEKIYEDNPFVAAVTVADYVRRNSPQTARIAVLGSEPEIYFYSRRHSATGYLYMYSLIVHQKYTARMRQEMIHELYANRPDYVIYVDEWGSWGDRDGGPQTEAFLSELDDFMDSQYEKVGIADGSRYVWGDAVKDYVASAPNVIWVLKRKQDVPLPGTSASPG